MNIVASSVSLQDFLFFLEEPSRLRGFHDPVLHSSGAGRINREGYS
jgi:hypothetical protein